MLCGSSTPVLPLLLPALCFGNLIFQMGRLAFCWALPQKSQGGQRARRATPSPLLASGAWLPRWGLALARTSPPPPPPLPGCPPSGQHSGEGAPVIPPPAWIPSEGEHSLKFLTLALSHLPLSFFVQHFQSFGNQLPLLNPL